MKIYRIILVIILVLSFKTNSSAEEIVLENNYLIVKFNSENGALEKIICKISGWEIERRSELAQSFYMNVPLPDQRYNPVIGKKQMLTNIEFIKEENRIIFTWEKLLSEKGGELNILFKGIVQLTEEGLIATAKVENHSPYVIESIRWPQLGDLSLPDKSNSFSQIGMDYAGMNQFEIFPKFQTEPGYFAVDNPMNWMESPTTPFILLQNGEKGLYVGYHDTTTRDLLQFKTELKPGYVSYELWDTGVNPKNDTLAGHPVHYEFSTVHFPFVEPGKTTELKPIVIKSYQGTWHKGADIYKKWRSTWFDPPKKPEWLQEVNSWQQIHMNNPEDDIRYKYSDLIEIGNECAANGVKAIQVTGWTKGGQDKDNPSHDIDHRLGTFEELKSAISEVQRLGVKIILFTKFTWADRTSAWYKDELNKHVTRDPYGEAHYYNGYAYQTDVQLAEINTRHFSPMCHLSPEWRKIADIEFKKTLDLGADGMLFDENQHHGGTKYCFDKTHGHKVPAYIFAGDEILSKGFEGIKNKIKPEYIFAGEGNYDLEFNEYHISYFRVDLDHVPLHRYIAPHEEMQIAISGYNDRNIVNTALLYRYIISYEPRNFKGRLSEFPMTLDYGKMIDEFRRKYKNYLWDGEFNHTVGASVLVGGEKHKNYSVFTEKNSGKMGIIVSNMNYNKYIDAEIKIEGNNRQLYRATPENPEAVSFNGRGKIPPNSAMFIFEK